MVKINSVEDLRDELAHVNKKITELQFQVANLMKYRNDISNRIKQIMSESHETIDITDFTGDDPVIEAMNSLKDTDEIRVEDVAYMLGITKAVLLSNVDPSRIKKIKLIYKGYKHTTLLLNVGYIKELLAANNKADKEKRKFVEALFEAYYNESIQIDIKCPVWKLNFVPYEKPEYKNLTIKQLIVGGYNRGFVKFAHFSTLMKMLDSFNSPYFVDYNSRTIMRNTEKRIIQVYS